MTHAERTPAWHLSKKSFLLWSATCGALPASTEPVPDAAIVHSRKPNPIRSHRVEPDAVPASYTERA